MNDNRNPNNILQIFLLLLLRSLMNGLGATLYIPIYLIYHVVDELKHNITSHLRTQLS